MALLTVNFSNMNKDAELDIPPHGLFHNGHVYEVDWIEEDTVLGEELDTTEVLDDPRLTPPEPQEVTMPGAEIPAAAGDVETLDDDDDDDDPEDGV